MPTRDPRRPRASDDRLLGLVEAGDRIGFAPDTLRKRMAQPNPPPMFKIGRSWRVWQTDLDTWAEAQREAAS